jgi:hypothetical protein
MRADTELRVARSGVKAGRRRGIWTAVAAALGWGAAVMMLATCEAATAPRSSHIVMVYSGDTALIAGTHTVPDVSITVNGEPYSNPHLVFRSSDTAVLSVATGAQGQDTLVARQIGTATVTSQLVSSVLAGGPPTITTTFFVGPKDVEFPRAALSLGSLGDTITLVPIAHDASGTQIDPSTYTVVWSSSDTTISRVTTKGRITAVANGTATVRAVIGADTAALPVTVQQKLAQFVISPPLSVTLNALGADTTLSATGRDSLGNPMPASAAVATWGVQSVGIVTVNASGRVQAVSNGTTYVYAISGATKDSLQVTVQQQAARIVVTAPNGLNIPAVGGTLVLTATSFDRNNNPVTIASPTLVSLDPGTAQVNSPTRTVTGIAIGTARIVADQDLVADTVKVTVANLPTKLSLSVDSAVMNSVGDTLRLTVTFTNALGSTITGLSPVWFSSDTTILSVATQDGRVVALRRGAARIIATYMTLADTAVITVTNAPASIQILAHTDTLHSLGDTLTIPINVRNSRNAPLPSTSVTWSVDNTTIATVSPSGTVTAHAVGRTTVRATNGILADSAALFVTNNPSRVVLNSHLDTLTARGQTLIYTATVTNRAGQAITGDTIVWRSTNATVASVTSIAPNAGLVTALAQGTTRIIGSVGTVADSATVVFRNPTLVYVDNSTLDTLHFGTLKRPFAHIQDGVNAADPGDTVFVRTGSGPYSESVVLNHDVTVEGDPTAYRAAGNDPTKLPLLSHDTGTAGITATTTARIVIRTLAIRHTLDGAAIYGKGPAIVISNVFVNPAGDPFNSGRGIAIDSTSRSSIDSSGVTNVKAYGFRYHGVVTGSITNSAVHGVVAAEAGTTGAGVEVLYGSSDLISTNLVRTTAGPEILLDSTASVTATANNVAGQAQLMRVLAATGATQVTNNTFNTRAQSGDPNTGDSQTDGRSALELNASPGVFVFGNSFSDNPGTTSLMDGIRLIGSRGAAGPAVLQRNTFQGGRFSVRSELSTWLLQLSHSTNAAVGVVLSNADSVTLDTDTLASAVTNCVQATGNNVQLAVTRGLYTQCGPAGNAAIEFNAPGAAVDVNSGVTFAGAAQRAIEVNGARHAFVIGNTMTGGSPEGPVNGSASVGVIDLQADSVTVVRNAVTGYPSYSAVALDGTMVRADSNFISQNRVGIRAGAISALEARTNDIFDNDSVGVVNQQAAGISIPNNWWGDSLGPRRDVVPTAAGDSADGNIVFTPLANVPLNAGTRPGMPLRKVFGNGQSASQGTTLAAPFTVRVVDAAGRPVAGVDVVFTVTPGGAMFGGGSATQTVSTNSSGLAEAVLTLGQPGTYTVTATNSTVGSVTFTATATP